MFENPVARVCFLIQQKALKSFGPCVLLYEKYYNLEVPARILIAYLFFPIFALFSIPKLVLRPLLILFYQTKRRLQVCYEVV